MPCKEYEQMESQQTIERSTWAQYTYRENAHRRGGVSSQTAKELAREARARATQIGKQMRWHCLKIRIVPQPQDGIVFAAQ
jgi:hypothetical protein